MAFCGQNCYNIGMKHTAEEIGAKMDALRLWKKAGNCNWAIKPQGTAFPFFCASIVTGPEPVKVRFLMLEGWQTFHDFLHFRLDPNFGFYVSPMEMPHFELVILAQGQARLFRHDPGYMPRTLTPQELELATKILWESYGILLRIETDGRLPLKFADDQSLFARVENADGLWEDTPLKVIPPRTYTENIHLQTKDIKTAKDLPFVRDEAIELEFNLQPELMTKEPRPRCCYRLLAVDGKSGERIIDCRASVSPESGLKGLWEALPQQVLSGLIRHGRIPGEIRLSSGRTFRLLRALSIHLPFKLSLHDSLEVLKLARA